MNVDCYVDNSHEIIFTLVGAQLGRSATKSGRRVAASV